ncbi:NADP-dependent oxidoreductase domain-containing protein [Vararia minispora EC-137]|uniref:NADP-dependent oxidoreductase domain-containing protein n=1 Tax=Vararia minispora EC-137 TaxID=1314806 RepID=A0ACB8QNB3_9AGAM|nr:NADP-dependent oxidoreductase domain-containing protein [Vararia minispora EC-137]
MSTTLNVQRKVPYVRLGKSGLKVSKIILGCMSYGAPESMPWVLGEKEGIEHIKFAYENGIQTFDTANIYSNGESERILGKAIKELGLPRDEIVVMTKLWGAVGRTHEDSGLFGAAADEKGYVNQHGGSRKHVFESVKHSLERLQLDYVDVLQVHRLDPDTPYEEMMQALHDVVKAGYVRYIGMSSCFVWQFHVLQNYAINNKLTPFISMQNHYNLLYREEEREMMPTLKHFGVGSIPWSPLARGNLTRPLGGASDRADKDPFAGVYLGKPGTEDIVNRVEEIAKKHNVSMAQVSLAWIMAKDPVSGPIVGTTSLEKLKDLIASVDVKLSEEEIKYLEEPYKPQEVFGHW